MEKQNEENFTFVWIIKNSYGCFFRKEYLRSPLFKFNSLPGMKWCFELYTGLTMGPEVGIFLSREDDLPEACQVSFGIQFLDCNEKEIFTKLPKTTLPVEFGKKFAWGYSNLVKRDLVLRSLISDILVIKSILKPFSQSKNQEILPAVNYSNGLFTDVLLRARGAEFKVHKAILWTRWPELAKKLDEQKSSQQDFDIGSNVLEAMINYVYTGNLGYVFNFEEVCVTAAKYGLRILGPTPDSIKTCKTRFDMEKITFVWPIENFSSLPVNTELCHEFKTENPGFSKWSLRVHICEKTDTDQIFDVFVCKILEQSWVLKTMLVRTKVSFDEANSSENENVFKTDENWKCAEFSRNIFSDTDDILLLRCELKLYNGGYSSDIVEFASWVGDTNLNRSLRTLYENGTLSDITIIAGSRRFPVHKFILESSVCCRMFETEMKESRNNQVEISDMDPDIMHQILLFLYTGNVEKLSEERVIQLYGVADKYDVSALKNVCKSSVTVANVCKILQLADMHHFDNLYQSAFEFFSDHLQEIYSTDEWKERSDNNFCVKLLQDVIARNKSTK